LQACSRSLRSREDELCFANIVIHSALVFGLHNELCDGTSIFIEEKKIPSHLNRRANTLDTLTACSDGVGKRVVVGPTELPFWRIEDAAFDQRCGFVGSVL
jgi:hypothetical protein